MKVNWVDTLKVFLHTVNSKNGYRPDLFVKAFGDFLSVGDSGTVRVTNSVRSADVILVIDMHMDSPANSYFKLVSSDLYRRYSAITLVYDESDKPMIFARGLFVSMPKMFHRSTSHVPVSYWTTPTDVFSLSQKKKDQTCLVSFRGNAKTHKCRGLLKKISFDGYEFHDTAGIVTTSVTTFDQSYVDLILSSKYSLCPRGNGTSSFRLFESLVLGVCPIIVSDQYVLPKMLSDYEHRRLTEWNINIQNLRGLLSGREPANAPISHAEYSMHFCSAIRDGMLTSAKTDSRYFRLNRVVWRLFKGIV